MKITFLGTSHGVPARGRNCTSMMIEEGDGIYFIDGGAPLIEEFLKIKEPSELAKVRGIFTTHAHSDHTFGILHMASLMDWFYKLPLDIYLTETGVVDAMKNLYSVSMSDSRGFNPELIRFHLETPDFVYEDENIKLSLIPTAHMADFGRPSYAILAETADRRVLFSGDMSYHLSRNDVPSIIGTEHLDLFVCEMAHFSLDELRPSLDGCLADRVYFNHIWPDEKFAVIESAKGDFPFEVRTVNDGDVVEL